MSVPETVAENCCVPPAGNVADCGEIASWIVTLLFDPAPGFELTPQPARAATVITAKPARSAALVANARGGFAPVWDEHDK